MENLYKIEQVKGHYEVYESDGKLVLSGDTWEECCNDLVELLVLSAKSNLEKC